MTDTQRKYADYLRAKAKALIEDAKLWAKYLPTYTPDKLEVIVANEPKLYIAIDNMTDEQVLKYFTISPFDRYFKGAYANFSPPLRELMVILKVCGYW